MASTSEFKRVWKDEIGNAFPLEAVLLRYVKGEPHYYCKLPFNRMFSIHVDKKHRTSVEDLVKYAKIFLSEGGYDMLSPVEDEIWQKIKSK